LLVDPNKPLSRLDIVMVTVGSIRYIAVALGLVIGFVFLLQATFRYGTKTFWYLGQLLGRRQAEFLLVFLVLIVAGLAFALKKSHQGWYGLIEIIFGVGSAANIAFSIVPGSSTLPQWVGLFGCTYFIVRGLGNVDEVVERRIKNARDAHSLATPIPPPAPPPAK
jgi:hypothetical protein